MGLKRVKEVYFRKGKRGGIMQERYIRDDIPCGFSTCPHCVANNPEKTLAVDGPANATYGPHGLFIVPDLDVVLNQMDVLESPPLTHMIISLTVLQESQHRRPIVYKRLRDLIGSSQRHVQLFANEFHHGCFVIRNENESAEQRNQRAVRRMVVWLRDHLGQFSSCSLLLISDHETQRQLAQQLGLSAVSLRQFLLSRTETVPLLEKIASTAEANEEILTRTGQVLYPAHLSATTLQHGLKSGRFFKGTFHASRDNYLEATVFVDQDKDSKDDPVGAVLIQGRRNLNRAVDADKVVIELLPESEWRSPLDMVLEEKADISSDDDDNNDISNEESLLQQQLLNDSSGSTTASSPKKRKRTAKKGPTVPIPKQKTGRIVGILRRGWRPYAGMLLTSHSSRGTSELFEPTERKIPRIRIETRQAERLRGQRIVVAIDSWPRTSRYPLGHYVGALGEVGNKEAENAVLLLERGIPYAPWSDQVLACLPSPDWLISDEERAKREDLRDIVICSIDPPGCTDIDDALHCRQIGQDLYEVGVHIADVTHFIRPGLELDEEAARRGTTVYLVDQRIDMVPALLSSNLCSLMGGHERLAFSVIWQLNGRAEVLATRFCKSVIKSKAALTYSRAQEIIDDENETGELAQSLRLLFRFSKLLKEKRLEAGALTLASTEVRFLVDSETHDPVDIEEPCAADTHSLVEEFMLLANVTVAQRIYDEFPNCAVLRRHPVPPLSNFDTIIKAAKAMGFTLHVNTGKELADSLNNIHSEQHPFLNTMLKVMTTRCMMQALYFSSGSVQSSQEFHHYGLAASIYTHFTSPIRRYADIMVHRLLAAAIGADVSFPKMMDNHRNQAICNNINVRHRMAQYASRDSIQLHIQLMFRDKPAIEDGYILAVKRNALSILVPKYGLEGLLLVDSPTAGKQSAIADSAKKATTATTSLFQYDAEMNCLLVPKQKLRLKVFDYVRVRLSIDVTNVQRQKLKIQLIKPKIEGFSIDEDALVEASK